MAFSPDSRHVSRASFVAFLPAASPSKSRTTSAAKRFRSLAWSTVKAVPSGATTFATPWAWSDTTSKFPSTTVAVSACRMAWRAW